MRPAIAMAMLAVVACTQTRYSSTTSAPGRVTLAPPPFENGSPELFIEAEDPGEHELYLGPGLVAGPTNGRQSDLDSNDDAGVELGLFLRIAYKTTATSHRQNDLPWPAPGWTLNLGWAPLQYGRHADFGPVHVEVERQWFLASLGAGVAIYPDDGNAGLQFTAAFKPYGVRMRYMAETGWEFLGAFQLELPSAVTWSR